MLLPKAFTCDFFELRASKVSYRIAVSVPDLRDSPIPKIISAIIKWVKFLAKGNRLKPIVDKIKGK